MEITQHVYDLLPAYALDCLDEAEKQMVADHLKNCADCSQELRTYLRVTDQLALGVKDNAPPVRLKDHIISQVVRGKGQKLADQPDVWWNWISQALQRIVPVWGLASLVLVMVLGARNLMLQHQLDAIELEMQSSLMTIRLTGAERSPEATGMLVISRDGEYGTLVVDGLPLLEPSQEYQIWLIKDGVRTSGGVFSVGEGGYGALRISSAEPLSNYSAFGITIEPAGGSAAPTGAKVLGGQT
jgi:anti-sigma-K factor RskA